MALGGSSYDRAIMTRKKRANRRERRAVTRFSSKTYKYSPSVLLLTPSQYPSIIMPSADARSESRVSNYTKFWKKDSAQDGDADRENRLEQYTDLVNGYYDGATELYEYGWGRWRAYQLVADSVRPVFPLLSLLQGRGLPPGSCPPRALPRVDDGSPPGHARS